MIINLNCAAILKKFKYHKEIKENLLTLINNAYSDHMQNDFYGDDINKLDWSKNLNYNREWIQYVKNNTHTWHVHGENYTGVYYLEFPKDSPKTELVDQLNLNKKIIIEAVEGDVVIFPSFIIHRSPKVISDLRKTIISFNLHFTKVKDSVFSTLNSL